MPTPRKTTAALAASGAFDKNPARAAGRGVDAKPSGQLRECPEFLEEVERQCWAEIVASAAPGALTNADNLAVEAMARLMGTVRSGKATAATYGQLGQYLDRFGMNPKSRANVQIAPPKDESNPFERVGGKR